MSTTNPTKIRTEWEILQTKYGNLPEAPQEITNEERSKDFIEYLEHQDYLDKKSLNELNAMEDNIDEEALDYYRKKRLEELAREKQRYCFGSVVRVGKSDYIQEVTEASKASPRANVILLLYNNCRLVCHVLIEAFKTLASKHGYAKFCMALGSDVIPDMPESKFPAVLVYKNGQCIDQMFGSQQWGDDKATCDLVEWVLWEKGFLDHAELNENPLGKNTERTHKSRKGRIEYRRIEHGSEDDDSSDSEDVRPLKHDRGYSSTYLESVFQHES